MRAGLKIATTFSAVILAWGCATSPTGRSQIMYMSESDMAQMGEQAFAQIKAETPISRDPQANQFVQCVAQRIIATLPGKAKLGWEVVVFDDNMVNAFALPGNKIGVYEGIFRVARNQDQLAAVIGHEVAHVMAHHANERVSTQALASSATRILAAGAGSTVSAEAIGLLGAGVQFGVLMPFNRKQESEADVIGLDYMARAGFEPGQSIALWENMERVQGGQAPPEFLSTHPSGESRLSTLRSELPKAQKLAEEAHANGLNPDCGF